LSDEATGVVESASSRRRKYASVRDALIALWEASDPVCDKRLVSMIHSHLACGLAAAVAAPSAKPQKLPY
jgi:hypothetical protein